MPLLAPILDDRSFQQLRDELVRRIPIYAPEWTDHNPSDPGVALIELFAFLGENLLFRFNQIPDHTRLAFLRLLQIPLRPPGVARALVTVTPEGFEGALLRPGGTRAFLPSFDPGAVARAGDVPFETLGELTPLPLELLAIGRIQRATLGEDEDDAVTPALQARGISLDEAGFYTSKRVPADPLAPTAEPVDFSATVDQTIWLAVLKGEKVTEDAATCVQRLRAEAVSVGFHPDEDVPDAASVDPCDGIPPHGRRNCRDGRAAAPDRPSVVFQVSTGAYDDVGRLRPRYRTLSIVEDTTAGLSRAGTVRLRIPETGPVADFEVLDPDLAGTGELPPLLEDDKEQARLLFWIRVFRRGGERPLGRYLWIGANAVEVVQSLRARPELLGQGDGQPGQSFALAHAPVLGKSLLLEVEEEPGDWRRWDEVDNFDASREDDRHFVVSAEDGQVRFGNTVKGYAPQIGQRIRALAYRYGGGAEGNVGAAAIAKLEASPDQRIGVPGRVDVSNPLPARGGSPAETLREALDRIPSELRRRDRAVTAEDFQALALATPGAEVGRADVLPLFCPKIPHDGFDAAGVVTVVVWPREDRKRPDAPMPDRTLLRQVCAHLDTRRLVTTELWVVPPTYKRIAVSVGVQVKPGYGPDAVRRWVELVLRQYLAPLPPYGPEGKGWPLGRTVHGPELEAAVLQVEGVEFLIRSPEAPGLRVARESAGGTFVEGPVEMARWEVPALAALTVVADGPPEPPGAELAPPTPERLPVAIPKPLEEC